MTDSIIKPETEKQLRDILDRANKSMSPIDRKMAQPIRGLLRAIEGNRRAHERLDRVAGTGAVKPRP